MDIRMLDLLLRGASFALAAAAASVIVLRGGRSRVAGLAAFCVAGLGSFSMSSMRGAVDVLGHCAFVFDAWCAATPAALWVLSGAMFRDGTRPGSTHLLAIGASVLPTVIGDWGRFGLGVLARWPQWAQPLLLAGRGLALAFVAAACAIALAHWRDDLLEDRRRARAAFVTVLLATFAALAASDLLFAGRGAPPPLLAAGQLALVGLSFALLVSVAAGGLDEVLARAQAQGPGLAVVPPAAVPAAPLPRLVSRRTGGAEIALARRVVEAMQAQSLWKREGLGIAELAREMGSQEYLLRRAINRHLGYRNFNDFLHDYRLAEVARRLADPRERHLPVLTIALDCGYGSIGPFNRAFKARFGLTPSQHRALRAEELPASGLGQLSR